MTPAQIEEARAIAARPGRDAVMRAVKEVSVESGVPVWEILGHSRLPHAVAARHLAIRAAHSDGVLAIEISRAFGMHHTSVGYAIRKGAA